MKTPITLIEAHNRIFDTLVFCPYGEQFVLTFTDGTYVAFNVNYDVASDLSLTEAPWASDEWLDETVLRAGLLTLDELVQLRANEAIQSLLQYRANRYAAYLRLKSEFESETPDNG